MMSPLQDGWLINVAIHFDRPTFLGSMTYGDGLGNTFVYSREYWIVHLDFGHS